MPHVRNIAIQKLEKSIETFYGKCIRLDETELNFYKNKGFTDGWEVGIRVAERNIPCAILVDSIFPFSSPRIAILGYGNFDPHIPHVGYDGLLCLGTTEYDFFSGKYSLQSLFQYVYALIGDGLSGNLDTDFQLEFLNYWSIDATDTAYACVKSQDRLSYIVYCDYKAKIYFFDSDTAGEKWLKRCFPELNSAKLFKKKISFKKTVLLPVKEIWLPSQYPQNGRDILELTKQLDFEYVRMLFECIPLFDKLSLPVLFSFPSQSGTIFVAAKVNSTQKFLNGFRQQHQGNRKSKIEASSAKYPPLFGQRFFSCSAKLQKMSVQRIDAEWLHYRGEAGRVQQLHDMKVAVLGCGSLGSQVADIFCKAGIGEIALFDPDTLLWDNIYRHILGSEYVGSKKAKALAMFLEKKFPETNILPYVSKWEKHFADGTSPQFQRFDLIISLIGDTENNTENFLSFCANHETPFPPVLFGWTEVWGAAGHALLLGTKDESDGCLLCKTNGQSQLRDVFGFNTDQIIRLPACSDSFAPYGFVDVAPIVSVIASLAFDFLSGEDVQDNYRIWISNVEKITKHGGMLNPWVTEKFGYIHGEQVLRTEWLLDSQCKICHATDL
jgi:hypothetical protein